MTRVRAAPGLQQEGALTGLADRTDGERIHLVELVEDAHHCLTTAELGE